MRVLCLAHVAAEGKNEDPREGWRAGSTECGIEDLGTTPQFVSGLALGLFYTKHSCTQIWHSGDDVWKNLHSSSLFLISHKRWLKMISAQYLQGEKGTKSKGRSWHNPSSAWALHSQGTAQKNWWKTPSSSSFSSSSSLQAGFCHPAKFPKCKTSVRHKDPGRRAAKIQTSFVPPTVKMLFWLLFTTDSYFLEQMSSPRQELQF